MLGEAADDARRAAGDAHYTGCWVRQELEKLELWLFAAPPQLVEELHEMRPGVYMIRNDAPRSYTAVLELMAALPADRLRAEGIRIVRYGPTHDGHLRVCAMGDVPPAQAYVDVTRTRPATRVARAPRPSDGFAARTDDESSGGRIGSGWVTRMSLSVQSGLTLGVRSRRCLTSTG
jgi:hypothetical protein